MRKRSISVKIVAGIAALILMIGVAAAAPNKITVAADDAAATENVTANTTFPSTFDLRSVDTNGDGVGDRCFVTPVKHQRPFGTCWGFAGIAAAETSILSDPTSPYYYDKNAYKTLNLSEKQLAYYSHVAIDDPSNPQNGEGSYTTVEAPAATDIYDVGGTAFLATSTFAAGMGPVLEDSPERSAEINELLKYHGINPDDPNAPPRIATKQDAAGNTYNYCYSAYDDWSMDEDYRFMYDFILRESYILPSPASAILVETGEPSLIPGIPAVEKYYQYDEEATNLIKDQIMNHYRAVIIGFHADTSRPWDDPSGKDGEYMSTQYWSHYTWKDDAANHAVLIVGWDDNYPKENFIDGHQPPENGAWLVKNSWGSGTEEFPERGDGTWGIQVPLLDKDGNEVKDEKGETVMVGSGYFWLSYYDYTLNSPEVLIFDTWLKGIGTKYQDSELGRDQYDLMPLTGMLGIPFDDKEVKEANVFTPETDVHIPSIGYQVSKANTTVTYEVYLLDEGYSSPTDGLLLTSNTKQYKFAGYYMEYLTPNNPDDPIIVQEGQSYSIVVTQVLDDGKSLLTLPYSNGPNSYQIEFGMSNTYSKAVVNEGESFFSRDGEWLDWSDETLRLDIVDDPMFVMFDPQIDNFPLKGFTLTEPLDISVALENNEKEITIKVGDDPTTINLEFTGTQTDLLHDDMEKTWAIYDGASDLFTMTPAADGTSAQLTGLKPGTAKVYAHVEDVGTVLFTVTVLEADPVPADDDTTDDDTAPDVTPDSTPDGTKPDTGDHNNMNQWMILMIISVLAVVIAVTAVAARKSRR